jgi:1-acyl-sn-glycerol-3-phosphate acyltransferase
MTVPRPLFYVAKHELFQTMFSRWLISSLGGIPLNRKRPLESRVSIRTIWSLLRKGEGIVIFPEGTYYPKTMGPGHSGLIRMICGRMEIPCIPVGIRYSSDRFRKSVRIVFGEPIYSNPGTDGPEFHQRIMREIAALSDLDAPPSLP